jgi:hypothetical protein
LLPDLQTLPPSDLVIEASGQPERKLLRLTNSVMNSGPGALELQGVFNPATNRTAVTQRIHTAAGSTVALAVGEFVFHPQHRHWHLEDFARYELWSLRPDGRLADLVALTDKLSFCLRDVIRSDMPGASDFSAYSRCDRELQGITSGWIDPYDFDLPGQIVEITGLPDGVYALRSITDPNNHLLELDETNNAASVYLQLSGETVRPIAGTALLRQLLSAYHRRQ